MITCQACGTQNPPDAAFCSKCARKLDPATQAAVVQTRASHSATGLDWSRIAIAVVSAIILILVIAFVITRVL